MEALQLYNKIEELRLERGIKTNYELCKIAGISQSTMYNWRQRGAIPSVPILEAICDALNYPLKQLFSDDTEEGLSEQKKHLLFLWDLMSSEQRQGFLQAMESSVKMKNRE